MNSSNQIDSLFIFKEISSKLILIEINHFDVVSFAEKFSDWCEKNQSLKAQKKPVVFQVDSKLEIDSADLALILEIARQNLLTPLGFVNTSKVVVDYAGFTNLALFNLGDFKNQIPLDLAKNQKINKAELNFDFFSQSPQFINKDIDKNLQCNKTTFIKGDVFLSVEIEAKANIYIYGRCFGQVSLDSEKGQIFIQKLRAKRIKIGSHQLESSQYSPELIDKPVVFYVKNNKIETRLITQ